MSMSKYVKKFNNKSFTTRTPPILVKPITKRMINKLRLLILSNLNTVKIKKIWNKALNMHWILFYIDEKRL